MVEKERRLDGGERYNGMEGGMMEIGRTANARKYGDDGEEGMEEEER